MKKVNKQYQSRWSITKLFPAIIVFFGLLGLLSSVELTAAKINVLKDPNFIPNCNINPIFSCQSIMSTAQAEIFGMPNSLVGIVMFTALITIGMTMFFGAKYNKRFWQLFQIGALGGLMGVVYLFYQGTYRIGAVCPWCALTWVSVIAVNVYLTVWNIKNGFIAVPKKLISASRFLEINHFGVLLLIYIVIVCLILKRFWYYFGA
ncbi:vitamin K epoxide reductase family protein [Candidatus Saccharibacteria bacterium]|jgi:uncharacterized membrane protein|nr:vitamin K epoxide reductase family protein [Candidatus Saccharibacteria bacterium]